MEPIELRQGQPGTVGPVNIVTGPDGEPHVTWSGYSGVFYTRRMDGEWTIPTLVYPETDEFVMPTLAIDTSGTAHMIYQDASTEARDLYYTRPVASPQAERDQTLTQETALPFKISDTTLRSEGPEVAVDALGNLHVIWLEGALREIGQGLAHRLRTGEGGWSVLANITETFGLWGERSAQLVPRPDGAMCIMFLGEQSRGQGQRLWQDCFINNGFTGPEQVAEDIGNNPQIVFDPGGNVHVVSLSRSNLFYTNVATGGSVELSDDFDANWPNLAIDSNGVLHVTYLRRGQPLTIVHRTSSDGGATWTEREDINNDMRVIAAGQLVADNRGRVHATFYSEGDIRYRVWSAESGWGEMQALQQDQPGPTGDVVLATGADGTPHVAWGNRRGVFYTTQDGDGIWSLPTPIVERTSSATPGLAVGPDGTVHIVYQNEDEENRDIYYVQP